jgi:hypothetical protein
MKVMKNKLAFWVTVMVSLSLGWLASCGSDEENKGASGSSGSGGTAGSGGSTSSSWKKGVVGKANQGSIVLAKNAGQIQGFAVRPGMAMRTMDLDAGLDADPEANPDGADDAAEDALLDAGDEAGTPNTAPTINFGGITPDFTEMWLPVPPYADANKKHTIAPLTIVVKPDASIETIEHFPDWTTEFTLGCFNTFATTVNGEELQSYGGLSVDMTECFGRHFFVSNASNKVYELFADGTREVLTDQLPEPGVPSALICHPEGYLVVSVLPGYVKNAPMSLPTEAPKLVKITTGSVPEVSLLATLPITSNYATPDQITTNWCFTHTKLAPASGIRIPLAVRSDASILVGDVGARIVYAVAKDGSTVEQFSDMPLLTASAIFAPNEVMYMIDAPLLNKAGDTVLQGTMIRAYDGSAWTDVLELEGYEPYVKNMSWGNYGAECPPQFASEGACRMPYGVFTKISHGASPILYIIDPIKGELVAVPLDMGGGVDAGTGGSAGSSGAGGEGGSAGTAGTAGTAGSAGASGSAGSAGTSGTAGTAGSAGSSG